MAKDLTREAVLQRWSALQSERSSWMSHYQELSTYLLPRNGRFFAGEQNKGQRVHNNIYDNTGTRSLRILGAGLMAGATSPARPWFRLGTHDPSLNSFQPVKVWLADVSQRMHTVFQKSNTYRALHQMYEELGAFGTAASIILPNYDTVIHHYPLTCGEYAISTDAQGKVVTLYRTFQMTVGQMVAEFGEDKCSRTVQQAYANHNLDAWFDVVHAIEPRSDRNPAKRDAKNMAWQSVYLEMGAEENKVLREAGFRQFPAVVPRWAICGGDIYGNSPGMECLGDIKQLQHEQLRKAQGIDYQTKPPLQVPASLKNHEIDTIPGGTTYYEGNAPQAPIKTLFDVNLNLSYLLADIQDVRERIRQGFFADLFMMIASSVDTKMTATEVAMLQEEKMLMLGPVLERLNNELLYPLIDITFQHMLEGGAIPPPPDELQGMDLSVEFVSMLAQAQRAIGVNGMDRFLTSLGTMAQMKPEVLDVVDADKWARTEADKLGVTPEVLIGQDTVMKVRQARDQAQAAAQKAALMQQQSETAKNLASAPTGGQPNALQDVMGMFSGYQSPTATELG